MLLPAVLLELLGLENRLLSMLKRLEVGRHRVNLAILFLIPVEALQGNVFPGQLGNRHKRSTRLFGSELLLLESKLLLVAVPAEGLCCWTARTRVALSTPVLCRPVYWKWGREWF